MKPTEMLRSIESRLKSEQPLRKKIWLDSLPHDIQQAALDVRKRFQEGKYPNSRIHVARTIADAVGPFLPKPPSLDSVERWLKK
jgi:hypothetical protein